MIIERMTSAPVHVMDADLWTRSGDESSTRAPGRRRCYAGGDLVCDSRSRRCSTTVAANGGLSEVRAELTSRDSSRATGDPIMTDHPVTSAPRKLVRTSGEGTGDLARLNLDRRTVQQQSGISDLQNFWFYLGDVFHTQGAGRTDSSSTLWTPMIRSARG